jgi:hypothetical protein
VAKVLLKTKQTGWAAPVVPPAQVLVTSFTPEAREATHLPMFLALGAALPPLPPEPAPLELAVQLPVVEPEARRPMAELVVPQVMYHPPLLPLVLVASTTPKVVVAEAEVAVKPLVPVAGLQVDVEVFQEEAQVHKVETITA